MTKAQRIRKWAQTAEDCGVFGVVETELFDYALDKWVWEVPGGPGMGEGPSLSLADEGGFAALLLHFIACAEE
jgi:hypothetical protein